MLDGRLTFDLVPNELGWAAGDRIEYREVDFELFSYMAESARSFIAEVTYVLHSPHVEGNRVILSIKVIPPEAPKPQPIEIPEQLDDVAWMLSLQDCAAYKHVNIAAEHARMVEWCRLRRKVPTRKRFLRWINNVEIPLNGVNGLDPKFRTF
jgi:hypothetical protein